MAAPIRKITTDNVIKPRLYVVGEKKKVRYNKDGSVDKRHSNSVAGKSCEVYPFTTQEEIKAIIDVLDKRIENAPDENKRQIAARNKMLFLVGINVGLRASDLVQLRYSYFYNSDMTFKDFYTLQPQKTKKTKKFVKIFFNQTVKKAIGDYIEDYPIEDLDAYLFKSREGNSYITAKALWRIIVDITSEAQLKLNYGTHSLRKTWAYTIWHNAEDKSKALVMLQQCLNHSDSMTTMRYIGIMDGEKKDMYESVEIGLDFI
jgi:integrase